jgi:CDP-glucose 4,6-dehydratase
MFENAFRGRRVLVTGHTGFKGAWLTQWLLKLGAEVCGYSTSVPTLPSLYYFLSLKEKIRDVRADIRDSRRLAKEFAEWKPEFVFHLAAQSLVRLSYAQPIETFEVNAMGTIQVLEALRNSPLPCVALMVTSDKCYENQERPAGYSEEDRLGGIDPYSSSKAMCELAVQSYRQAYFKDHRVRLASVRAGNVIGGGDWAADRIVPDSVRALQAAKDIAVRNPSACRPWQHVLEPLSGYLTLAAQMAAADNESRILELCSPFNFGPNEQSHQNVQQLVEAIIALWPLKAGPAKWIDQSDPNAVHEAKLLSLDTSKAKRLLSWSSRWDFAKTVGETVQWYREVHGEGNASEVTLRQIEDFEHSA